MRFGVKGDIYRAVVCWRSAVTIEAKCLLEASIKINLWWQRQGRQVLQSFLLHRPD